MFLVKETPMKDCFSCIHCGNYRWLHRIPPLDQGTEQKRERGHSGTINGFPFTLMNCPGFELDEGGKALERMYFPERFLANTKVISSRTLPVLLPEVPESAVFH